jgi:membrane protein
MPGGAIQVIGDELHRLVTQGRSKLSTAFIFSLVVALWSANAGMKSLFDALNLVYNEQERRGFIRLNAVSLAFTLSIIVFMLLTLGGMIALPVLLSHTWFGVSPDGLLSVVRWPVLLIVSGLGLAVLYRFGPSRPAAQWRWITWGTVFASVAWLAVSLLFTWYAANFGSYNKTYGSLGAIVGFMVWIWLSNIVVLLGAEIDAHFKRSAGKSVRGSEVNLIHTVGQPTDKLDRRGKTRVG